MEKTFFRDTDDTDDSGVGGVGTEGSTGTRNANNTQSANNDDSTDVQLRGDTVLLLRFGDDDVPIMREWLKARYDEYAPMRELRRLKEGREREYRISNHLKYRQRIFDMADNFLISLEKLYSLEKSRNDDFIDNYQHETQATTFSCRVLLSRFLELKADAETVGGDVKAVGGDGDMNLEGKINSMDIMDEAFLIDTDVAHSSEKQLERFDELPEEHVFTDRQALLNWETRRVGQYGIALTSVRHDLAPRVAQVLYAAYQLHCGQCKKPSNACAFPGCGSIREQANAVCQEAIVGNHPFVLYGYTHTVPMKPNLNHVSLGIDEFNDYLLELKTTGRHPLERAIRRHLLIEREFENTLLPVYCTPSEGTSPEEEIQRENQIDQLEVDRLERIEYLKLDYRSLLAEGSYLRFINRRRIAPELIGAITADDVLEAQGGIGNSNDDKTILLQEDVENALAHVPHVNDYVKITDHDEFQNVSSSVSVDSAMATKDVVQDVVKDDKVVNADDVGGAAIEVATSDKSYLGALLEIPKNVVKDFLGWCGVDAKGGLVPLWAVDPYPTKQKEKHAGTATTTDAVAGVDAAGIGKENGKERVIVVQTTGAEAGGGGGEGDVISKKGKHTPRQPMEKIMFNWLTEHMIVYRPENLIQHVSGDRGQNSKEAISLKIDRLHCEGTLFLLDGSLVTIQLLQVGANNLKILKS